MKKTNHVLGQFIRYTFVGGFAAVVDIGSLYLLTEYVGLYYLVASVFAFVLGLTTNYILSLIFVFTNRRLKKKWVEFIIFASIGIVGLGLNTFLLWFFTEQIELYYMVSKLIATAVVFFYNFGLRKYILFK